MSFTYGAMTDMDGKERLELTEEEAFALLSLSMVSHERLDKASEQALKKLADYCRTYLRNHSSAVSACELGEAG